MLTLMCSVRLSNVDAFFATLDIQHMFACSTTEFFGSFLHQGPFALTVGSVPRRIVPELRHFHWLLKMNNQSN